MFVWILGLVSGLGLVVVVLFSKVFILYGLYCIFQGVGW